MITITCEIKKNRDGTCTIHVSHDVANDILTGHAYQYNNMTPWYLPIIV